MRLNFVAIAASLAGLAIARIPVKQDFHSTIEHNGAKFTVFNHAATGAQLKYLDSSGICETTPNVKAYSGYLSPDGKNNIFFWFFEARKNADTAPLAAWFNGGPGCSSLIGLFQENGPCQFVGSAKSPTLNSKSWNNNVNMLYIDQPYGTGFSPSASGSSPVTGTDTAAQVVWKFLQLFFADPNFSKYQSRDFGIFTESYGGHYGPQFADYLAQQNDAIASGRVSGTKINLVALGINNGWIDPAIGYQSYIDYSYSNEYKNWTSKSQYTSYQSKMTSCASALKKCDSSGTNSACSSAQNSCYSSIEGPIANRLADVYDVRDPTGSSGQPSEAYINWLSGQRTKIGATLATFQECGDDPYYDFADSGDNSRSYMNALADVVSRGVTVLVWAGDADFICNWYGNEKVANQVAKQLGLNDWPSTYSKYTVNGANGSHMFKTSKQMKFSFLRVHAAGHEVPFYQPDVALQAFEQTMLGKAVLHAT